MERLEKFSFVLLDIAKFLAFKLQEILENSNF